VLITLSEIAGQSPATNMYGPMGRRSRLSQPHIGRKLWRERAWELKHPAEIGQNRQTLRRHFDKD
jgi:hypothetical protein